MTTPYARRIISLTFQLGEGSFGQSGFNELTLTGLRAIVSVSQAVTPTPSQAYIRVFGLTADHINSLTRAGYSYQSRANYVAIQAGDADSGLTPIFNGTIYEAYPDFRSQPETSFVIIANPAAVIQLQPVTPVSFPGSIAASTALERIMKPTGFTVENNAVTVTLASPYFPGTVWQQMLSCVRAANAFSHYDPVNKLVAIWPKNGRRTGGTTPTISAANEMINYPEFMHNRVKVRTIFDPTIRGPGHPIIISSSLKSANNTWILDQVDYNISAEIPGGPWEMTLTAHPAD